MVANLNRVSPLLALIPVPDGDFDAHVRSTRVAINLQRLGCSGRSALTMEYSMYGHPLRRRARRASEAAIDACLLIAWWWWWGHAHVRWCARTRNPTDREARDRFLNVLRTSLAIPFEYTVLQLGRLVQLSLHFFNLFHLEEVDGVLCKDTVDALEKYRAHFGVARGEVCTRMRAHGTETTGA